MLCLEIHSLPSLCDEGIEHLATTIPQLHMLSLSQSDQITDACMSVIGCLTNLVELGLGACTGLTDKGMIHLQLLTNLEYLGLPLNRDCTSRMLQYLRSPCLHSIDCIGSGIDPKAAKARIAELRKW